MTADLRRALRALRARPALALGLLLTLALGVGANAAMLGALDALLVRPPAGVRDAERVARLYVRSGDDATPGAVTAYPFFAAVRARAAAPGGALDGAAAWTDFEVPVGAGATARPAKTRAVSGGFFGLLGARPALGRLLGPADDRADATAPAVVLGHRYWRQAFGGDPGVLGRVLRVGPLQARVVGVAGPGFAGVDFGRVDLWLPLAPSARAGYGEEGLTNASFTWLRLLARPSAGAAPARVAAELTAAYRATMRGAGEQAQPDWQRAQVVLGPLQEARGPAGGAARRLPLWLAAMSGALLLAAAANATGLLVARALERRRETAVRLALGARVRHLARAAAAEALVLAAGGAALAAGAAALLGGAVRRFVLGEAFAELPALDGRRLAIVAAAALAVCLGAALAAARVARPGGRGARGPGAPRDPLGAELRAGARGGTRAGGRTLVALVGAQAALTFVLLGGAALFAESLRRATAERIGYDAGQVLLVAFDQSGLEADPAAGLAAQRDRYARARARLLALPGVAGATPVSGPTLRFVNGIRVRVPGRADAASAPGGSHYTVVAPDYFAVSGTRLLAGRAPAAAPAPGGTAPDGTPADWPARAPRAWEREVVVGAHAARLLWPGVSPLGRCVLVGDDDGCRTVVGVAEEARRFELVEAAAVQLYVGGDFATRAPGAMLVRTRGPADALAPAVRRALVALDPAAPPAEVRSLAEIFAPNYRPFQAGAALLGAFGLVALALAAAGLAGAVGYAAATRTREIGVRVALGARAADVRRLLVGGALGAVGAGLGAGALLSLAGGRAVGALLYGVAPADPRALGLAALTLASTAAAVALLAARRGLAVPPTEALRAD
jgi:predicted permease